MVGSNKILTVSYGTFSCTLEGFDDSFSTMKAIAEYFRDLAADDRYFGAEPPTPDAEMLARIAERETTRRVEARTSASGIVLRAASALPVAAEEAPAAAVPPKTAQHSEVEAAIAPTSPEPVADTAEVATVEVVMPPVVERPATVAEVPAALKAAAVATEKPAAHELTFEDMAPATVNKFVPANPDVDSVAAKLQRIRAVTNKAAPRPQAYAEDQHVRADMPITNTAEDEFEADETAVETFFAATDTVVSPEAVEEDVVVEETAEEAPSVDLAEEVALSQEEDSSEDLADLALLDGADVAEVIEETTEADVDNAEVEEVEVAQETTLDDYTDADVAQYLPLEDDLAEDVQAADDSELEEDTADAPSEADEDDFAASAEKPTIRARIVRLRQGIPLGGGVVASDADQSGEHVEVDTFTEDDNAVSAVVDEPVPVAEADDETIDEDDVDFATDDAAEIALSDDINDLEGVNGIVDSFTMDDSGLSAEDEAELQEELADVARDIADTPAPARAGRNILPKNDDDAMSRIMSQTDEALNDPENSRRRNAIAQLKAAVVATEAARQLGDSSDSAKEDENAFRKDLDQVVRPRRPVQSEPEDVRTARPRPAPLKLVASQRVDAPTASNAAPVLPKRVAVTTTEAPSVSDASSFAEFAAEMGATDLNDLLEAAAAYTAFVEGSEDFSRPQIMKKVQLTIDREFTREDGLRSFGTLLRQGRISKVRNGRFQVSDQTRFRPEPRAARG